MSTFSSKSVSTEAFYYRGGKLKKITAITNYGKVRFKKMFAHATNGCWLYMSSINADKENIGGLLSSFRGTQEGIQLHVAFRFRTNEASTMYLNGKSQKILAIHQPDFIYAMQEKKVFF